jgi:hypothetical protein
MAAPDMVFVDSSSVEAIGYDVDERELWVQFHGGRTYVYSEVPEEVYQEFVQADSKGSYFNRELKPNYAWREA